MYSYRSLQPSDLETLCSFPQNEEELYFMFPNAVYPLTPKQITKAVKNRLEPTIILHNDEAVSYANFYDHDDGSCWLGNVIVSPGYRGKGASQFLIETMESIAIQKLNVKRLKLVCHNTNTRGILFYKKHGFKPFDISLRLKPSGGYIAGIHMEKILLHYPI
ncbi:GNAT family N-acetyltransferase [Paenibacillus sp. PL91]|uniref:GNAT family N-acetyltransferase n=1 Tax=Paenibacillus sp. PL91 TaxID=2729538 RepID=UPI00145DDAE1|nr:GNAT family N-acetyltransferase [Paenibacillus sp. PL91]MBC9199243.1 GNAT family N-acetyltransferase [Paenibacillus sp. PL91]